MDNYFNDYTEYAPQTQNQTVTNNQNASHNIPEQPKTRIAFFLGAGASAKAGVPTMAKFIEEFKIYINTFDKNLYSEYLKIEKLLKKTKKIIDLETIIESLDLLTLDVNDQNIVINSFFGDLKSFINLRKIEILKKELMGFIRKKTFIDNPEKIEYLKPLYDLIEIYGPIDIFSVNYDTCIELLSHKHGLKYTDGFELYWDSSLLDDETKHIYLYKLHGSAIWYQTDANTYIKIPLKNPPENVHTLTGEKGATLIIYPTREKYSFVEPLSELAHYFRKRLKMANICIIAGYSMRDESITTIFQEAIRNNENLVLFFISPNAGKYYNDLLKKGSFFNDRIIPIPGNFEKILENNNLYNIIGNLFEAYQKGLKYKEARIKGNLYNDLKIETALSFSKAFFGSIAEKLLNDVDLNEVGRNKTNWSDVSKILQLYFYQIIFNIIIKNKTNLTKNVNNMILLQKKFTNERLFKRVKKEENKLPSTITYEILNYDIPLLEITREFIPEQLRLIKYFKTILSNSKINNKLNQIENKINTLENIEKIIDKLRILIVHKDQDASDIINEIIHFAKNCKIESIIPNKNQLRELPCNYIESNEPYIDFLKSINDKKPFDDIYKIFLKTYDEYYSELELLKRL